MIISTPTSPPTNTSLPHSPLHLQTTSLPHSPLHLQTTTLTSPPTNYLTTTLTSAPTNTSLPHPPLHLQTPHYHTHCSTYQNTPLHLQTPHYHTHFSTYITKWQAGRQDAIAVSFDDDDDDDKEEEEKDEEEQKMMRRKSRKEMKRKKERMRKRLGATCGNLQHANQSTPTITACGGRLHCKGEDKRTPVSKWEGKWEGKEVRFEGNGNGVYLDGERVKVVNGDGGSV
ncbi:hypothetical protein Pcinc_043302 [Petrolisthes cinctipes]|uniref:Uncharacterized protein n=1 Tax=Petrolisthes cinctipes TaxID=88211 RepID=A0AAE1BFV7_PETCI|nr:hypothetical protein Pcinc_043302 [Petrolisthes cinctipes]